MSMPGVSELLIIMAAIVFLFGASKLPALGTAIGEGIRNLKKGLSEPKNEQTEGKKE
jgi:sec-independent protein translocase protein TatA